VPSRTGPLERIAGRYTVRHAETVTSPVPESLLLPIARRVILRMNMTSKRSSKVLAVSVPPAAATEFEALARAEGRNKSELFREMLRVYGVYRETGAFESLQRYGAARAREVGVRDEHDVERLIAKARGM